VLLVLSRVVRVAEAEDGIGVAEAVSETKDTLILAVFTLILTAVAYVVVKYRDRFLLFFFRDGRVHTSMHKLLWLVCCRCGGVCDGEWTRSLTSRFCCWYPALRGVNLKRHWGQKLGIVPIPVRMSNIVVGDLPCAGRSSFYVEVSAGDHPPQTTSVREEQLPKAVQFEDTLIFHTRDSLTEKKIHIVVNELHVLGFRSLCDCYISSKRVLRWQKRQNGEAIGPRRVRMTPVDRRDNPSIFPPWILIDFVPRPEWNNQSGGFGLSVSMHGNVSDSPEFPTAADFKNSFPLQDPRGAAADEPPEGEVGKLHDLMRRRSSVARTCRLLLWLPLVSFLLCHFGAFVCYDGYFKIQVFTQHNQSFPVPRDVRELVTDDCGTYLTGNEALRYVRHMLLLQYRQAQAAADVTSEGLDSVADAGLNDHEGHLDSATSLRRRRPSDLVGAARDGTFDVAASANVNVTGAANETGGLVSEADVATRNLTDGLVNATGAASEIAGSASSAASAAAQRLAGTTAGGREAGADVRAAGAAGASEPTAERETDQGEGAAGADGAGAASARSDVEQPPLPASVPGNFEFLPPPARQDAGEAGRRLGSGPGENPCRPTMKQVLEGACAELPERAPHPRLFEDYLLGLVRCPTGACRTTHELDKASRWVIAYVAVWVLCYWLIGLRFDRLIDDQEEKVNSNDDQYSSRGNAVNSKNGPVIRGEFKPGYTLLPTQE
jgi:hypothetical protein